jgi:antitoxin VapB
MAAVAKVFMSGRSQAVRLPKQFRVKCKEMYISKENDAIVLKPKEEEPMTWEKFFAMGPCPDKLDLERDMSPPEDRHLFDDWHDDEGNDEVHA